MSAWKWANLVVAVNIVAATPPWAADQVMNLLGVLRIVAVEAMQCEVSLVPLDQNLLLVFCGRLWLAEKTGLFEKSVFAKKQLLQRSNKLLFLLFITSLNCLVDASQEVERLVRHVVDPRVLSSWLHQIF